MEQGSDAADRAVYIISTAAQYREAIARLRVLEGKPKSPPVARERDALELAVSRYLTLGDRPGSQDRNDQ
ncbi:hypothetical protein DK26_01325 [Bosea sp. WAO]|nr:hypothetical protein DK26_01325 [Bosea sp. WAO]